jgi:hypothetical protein
MPSPRNARRPRGTLNANGDESLGDLMNQRLRGLIILAIGLWLAKWQIWDPLHAAELGLEEVTIYKLALAGAVILPPLGLFFILFGEKAKAFFAAMSPMDPSNLTLRDFVLLGLFAVLLVPAGWFITDALEEQGYFELMHHSGEARSSE